MFLFKNCSLKIDLISNFKDLCTDNIRKAGFKVGNYSKGIYEYFNLQRKRISLQKRKIEKSREFCCPHEYEPALKEIENKIMLGKNLIPFLSKKILYADYNDKLLNDWNIQHLHLSRRYGNDGFVRRSNYELFIYFTNDTAYFLQIYPHREDNLYCKEELVKLIYANWPNLIEAYKLNEITSLERKISDKERNSLRSKNALNLIEVDKNVFYAPGGGYASNGYSLIALNSADAMVDKIRYIECELICETEVIIEKMKLIKTTVEAQLNIILVKIISLDEVLLFEKSNGVFLLIKSNKMYFFQTWDMHIESYLVSITKLEQYSTRKVKR